MGYSIIVPVKEINAYIHESVPITLRLNYADFEIIIVPNELPSGEQPSYLQDPRVRLLASGRVSPAVKRDMGAEVARYEYLAFLDDDAYPEKDWLRAADRAFAASKAAAVGGPAQTPPDSSLGEHASGLFFETIIGGGGMDFRYKPAAKSFFVDDYPTVNLIVAKEAFFAVGGFDNEFWPGEDTKFCLDLVKAGYKIWYANDVVVWHHRRNLLRPHLKQVGNYGKHRGYFAKRFPETSLRAVYFAPTVFLLGNIVLAVATLFQVPGAGALWAGLLGLYFAIALVDVAWRTRNPVIGLLTIITIFCSHLIYGWMFARGLISSQGFRSQLR